MTSDHERGRIYAALVTYRRTHLVSAYLTALLDEQTTTPHGLVVVDNSPDGSVEAILAGFRPRHSVLYIGADNVGPAGGLALALDVLRPHMTQADFFLCLDDDQPPIEEDLLARLLEFAQQRLADDPRTGGVGTVGATFNSRTGRVLRPADKDIAAINSVDYIGGGHFPMYTVPALDAVGGHDPRLFFGFEELELGLRMRSQGWSLYIDGETWLQERSRHGRLNLKVRPSWVMSTDPPWRQYYATRNLVYLLSRRRLWPALCRLLVVRIAKHLLLFIRQPNAAVRSGQVDLAAWRDGITGRLGRTFSVDV